MAKRKPAAQICKGLNRRLVYVSLENAELRASAFFFRLHRVECGTRIYH